jgi:hypothetical protein
MVRNYMSQQGQPFFTFARWILDYLKVIKYPAEISCIAIETIVSRLTNFNCRWPQKQLTPDIRRI